jgi:hypothetical protein
MAPAKKALTPAQVRERRARIAAVVLGGVFLLVAVIQVPKLMKQLKGAPSQATAAAPVVSPVTSPGTPVAALTSQNVGAGQLTRFSHFAGKDPFKALVNLTAGAPAQTSTTGSQTPATKLSVVPPPTQPSVAFTQKPTGPTVPAALILYNGKKLTVALGFGFPAKHPMFRLVTLGVDTVRIGLVGGSFSNGKTTLPLQRGHKVSLSDATTGDKFVLRLVKLTTAPAPKATTPPAS